MQRHDVIVVGGGPAGSACAATLARAGMDVAVLDLAEFPRLKLCAGWVTPEVLRALDFEPGKYPHRFNTFDEQVVHIKGLTFNIKEPQHSIRRYEFDDFLLRACGATVHRHTVKQIRMDASGYVLDDTYRSRFLVGAGGTRCPVYRAFFRELNPRAKEDQIVTYEHEFPHAWEDSRCHLWFFDQGLPGYAWYVPKENGYLNCGIGGLADQLKHRNEDIKRYWSHFVKKLSTTLSVEGLSPDEGRGYSYYFRGNVDVLRSGNAFIIGDAAGLATRDLAEGIGPAVQSGQLAARAILTGSEYALSSIDMYSTKKQLVRNLLAFMYRGWGSRLLGRRMSQRSGRSTTHADRLSSD